MKKFDSHFHIINPKYPLFENNGYVSPNFTIENHQEETESLDISGGAIVSGSFQKFEQEYLVDALSNLGENYAGMANIPLDMEASELERLNKSLWTESP